MFGLIYEYDDTYTSTQRIDWFDTKEELLDAYEQVSKLEQDAIKNNKLYLSMVINYTQEEMENNF